MLELSFEFFDPQDEPDLLDDHELLAGDLIDYAVVGPIYPAWLPGADRMLRYYDMGEYRPGNAIFIREEDRSPITADLIAAVNYELRRLGHWREL